MHKQWILRAAESKLNRAPGGSDKVNKDDAYDCFLFLICFLLQRVMCRAATFPEQRAAPGRAEMWALSTRPITPHVRYTSTREVAATGAGPSPRVAFHFQRTAASLSISLLPHLRLRRFAMLSGHDCGLQCCHARGHKIQTNQTQRFAGRRALSYRTGSAALPRRQALLESFGAISLMTDGWLRGG